MSIAVNHAVLAKGWGRFTVMHKDRKVAAISEDGTCTIYAPSFMPYNLYLETANDLDTRLNNLNNFYYWCSSRVLPPDRKYAKEILNSIGARQTATDLDRAAIAISYHGLNQIAEINPEWFEDQATRDMFFRRLEAVKNADSAGAL